MKNSKKISENIFSIFATNQNYHAEQRDDGRYTKKNGKITASKIELVIESESSVAIYQRNVDETIKWICYDFDVTKPNINGQARAIAEVELKRAVRDFCSFLEDKKIPYLLEFSGNRGFHVWIIFSNLIDYKVGFDILDLLMNESELNVNNEFVAIDLFPRSKKITGSVGLGVKMPLSKHKKSGYYSYLLKSKDEINNVKLISSLTDDILVLQLDILNENKSIDKSVIEKTFNVFLLSTNEADVYQQRIREIKVGGLDLDKLLEHWGKNALLNNFKNEIINGNLDNNKRKLLVGIFFGVINPRGENIGKEFLIKLFEKQNNYNEETTLKAINKLSSFNFPSKEQIEDVVRLRFNDEFEIEGLLNLIFYDLVSFDHGFFDFCKKDIDITKIAEMNYVIQNDEAQSRKVMNELNGLDSDECLSYVQDFFNNNKKPKIKYYKHVRIEGKKNRNLITLETYERIITSMIMKQIHYFYSIQDSDSTHGYRVNKGFKGGYIFSPWMYLWRKFLSNISSALDEKSNMEFFIIKTDITGFYDNISHDKLKRLLLDGVSSNKIDKKIQSLDDISQKKYTKLIDTCLEITKEVMGSDIGLPQGPAYARFFSELYLSNIDSYFEELLHNDNIILYQRYVDDFFFICKTESDAKIYLDNLIVYLTELGLEINKDKTLTKKVKDFFPNYEQYRSQSKYSVDKISQKFEMATAKEKDLAIIDFMTLVSSDTVQEDLSFIYSHLKDVSQVEQYKNDLIRPTIDSGIGRGSLYRNLFNYILDKEDLWHFLIETNKFNSLQSEVLTSSIINFIEEGKSRHEKFHELMTAITGKLTLTRMVEEHIFQINLFVGDSIDIANISVDTILDIIISSAVNNKSVEINEGLIKYLNTEINSLHDKYSFFNALYAICSSWSLSDKSINELSSIFYSFLNLFMTKTEFNKTEADIKESLSFSCKYYFLICLFSLSSKNSNDDLLINMWRYGASLFNKFGKEYKEEVNNGWIHKLSKLDICSKKTNLILTSIIDGEIFRGIEDKRKIFQRYHTLTLVCLSSEFSSWDNKEINDLLLEIKDKSEFYKWIIDNNDVNFLPENRDWFDKNIIENNVVMLRKDNSVLFRKPDELLAEPALAKSTEDGFSELIVSYDYNELNSIAGVLSNLNLPDFVKELVRSLESNVKNNSYPNIFSSERLVRNNSFEPFSDELYNSPFLIFEDGVKRISINNNNMKNFINSLFYSIPNVDKYKPTWVMYEKYIKNLTPDINIQLFLSNLNKQFDLFEKYDDDKSPFYLDLSIASASYASIDNRQNDLIAMEKFVVFYFLANENSADKHIFSVDISSCISEANPITFLDTIINSIKLTKLKAFPPLLLDIDADIENYKQSIERLFDTNLDEGIILSLNSFVKCQLEISPTSRNITLGDGSAFLYEKIKIVNPIVREIVEFSDASIFYIKSSTHRYSLVYGGFLYLLVLPSVFTKIYDEISAKYSLLNENETRSYPVYEINRKKIIELRRFDEAVSVISVHNDIAIAESTELLVTWLASFPEVYREIFIILIAAHETMPLSDIDLFCKKTLELIRENSNVILIKKLEDYNGTQRCFHRNEALSRVLDRLNPNNLKLGIEEITIATDVIISGSQIKKALEYYLSIDGDGDEYYPKFDKLNVPLSSKLSSIKTINICCVLYTQDGLNFIKESCSTFMPNLSDVIAINGRDMGGNAIFSTTKKIGNDDKKRISEVLQNQDECKRIYSLLNVSMRKSRDAKRYTIISIEKINRINLVARYKSLPKLCFDFLYIGVKTNPELHPMKRILERNGF